MTLTERQELAGYISDTYKSLNGIRPRWIDFENAPIEALREEAADLQRQVERDIREEQEAAEREAAAMVPSPAWTIGDFCDAVIALNR